MDFEKIMQEITSGLTGDGEKDIKYLMEQCEKYKDHISLLENFSSEFNTDYTSVEDDFYCVKLNELSNG